MVTDRELKNQGEWISGLVSPTTTVITIPTLTFKFEKLFVIVFVRIMKEDIFDFYCSHLFSFYCVLFLFFFLCSLSPAQATICTEKRGETASLASG